MRLVQYTVPTKPSTALLSRQSGTMLVKCFKRTERAGGKIGRSNRCAVLFHSASDQVRLYKRD